MIDSTTPGRSQRHRHFNTFNLCHVIIRQNPFKRQESQILLGPYPQDPRPQRTSSSLFQRRHQKTLSQRLVQGTLPSGKGFNSFRQHPELQAISRGFPRYHPKDRHALQGVRKAPQFNAVDPTMQTLSQPQGTSSKKGWEVQKQKRFIDKNDEGQMGIRI